VRLGLLGGGVEEGEVGYPGGKEGGRRNVHGEGREGKGTKGGWMFAKRRRADRAEEKREGWTFIQPDV